MAEDSSKGRININYLGSGIYRLMVKANDYKEAEKLMKNAAEAAMGFMVRNAGAVEFSRDES